MNIQRQPMKHLLMDLEAHHSSLLEYLLMKFGIVTDNTPLFSRNLEDHPMAIPPPNGAHSISHCFLFHSTHSSNFTPDPPKISRALPIVKSTFPLLSSLTSSRSSRERPPPAKVTGILHHSASLDTSSWSMPRWRPSTSAAWIRNSEQWGSRRDIDSVWM